MGYRVLGVLSWGSRVTSKFSAPPSGETMSNPQSYWGARTYSTSSITVPSLVGLGFHPPRGRTKTLSFCLFICSSRCWTSEIVRPISPRMRWSTETISMPLNRGICVCIRVQLWRSRKTSRSRPCKLSVSVSWNCRKVLVSILSPAKNRMSRLGLVS